MTNNVSLVRFGVQPAGSRDTLIFKFHPNDPQGNWSWELLGEVHYLQLDYARSMVLFKSCRFAWRDINIAAFRKLMPFGLHLTGKEHIEKRICLNYFGHQSAEAVRCKASTLDALCTEHAGGEDVETCFNCGSAYNEEAEEEAEALLCDCGFPEEDCQCPRCNNCGERGDACVCEICDDCNLCLCVSESHTEQSHRPCDCETQCTPDERIVRHEIRSCSCHEKRCPDCDHEVCECASHSDSESYEYKFDE